MHIIDTCLIDQSKLFEKLLSEALETGPDYAPLVGPSMAQLELACSALVMRPPQALADQLAACTAEMASMFPGQLFYGRSNIHMTVSALPKLVPGSQMANHLGRSLASHVGSLKPLSMSVKGLGIIGSAVVFKAFDKEGQLGRLVRYLVADLEEGGFAMSEQAGFHTKIFWLTAARLMQPPSQAMLDYVVQNGEREFGQANFEAIQLVSTDSLFSEAATSTIKTYNLADYY
jgi:2'-5' RNA ligase